MKKQRMKQRRGHKAGRRIRREFRPNGEDRSKGAQGAADTKSAIRVGELHLHRDGYGFVVTAGLDEDVFIPARFVGDALHTDLVLVTPVCGRAGKIEGRINQIIERRVKSLMGRFERHGKACQVVADDRRVRHRILIPDNAVGGARHGDNVIVLIRRYPTGDVPMLGEVIQILGKRGEVQTEKAAIIARYQLQREFSGHVLEEADRMAAMSSSVSDKNRVDLTDVPFVTIDGETAKDFDDAVSVRRVENGIIRLWVSIADVSHFVRPGSALDKAAYERGTSVYFPGDCLPMLPEAISNDKCSLRPHEDRFTVTAEMDIDMNGEVARSRFYRSVIKSRERMTYTAMRQILVDRDASVLERYGDLVEQFKLMEECFNRLWKTRLKRGSIDFDLPEPEIVIDMQGVISNIVRAERHVGHMMIEAFMIAANESVAEFLTKRGGGCMYRVHEPSPPDKLRELFILLNNLGHKVRMGRGVTPGQLAGIVNAVRGRPEERLVNHMLLRSMSQAVYSPENLGHFGLASSCYCHFTSPIRRYPDLVVQRLLTRALARRDTKDEQRGTRDEGRRMRPLRESAEHSSRRERIAMGAEREMAKLNAALFMQERVGEEFDGVISHVTKFGFFVELIDFFVEGLVHITSLDDDGYAYEERGLMLVGGRGKKKFRIGDRVRVEVFEVDIPNREIVFVLV